MPENTPTVKRHYSNLSFEDITHKLNNKGAPRDAAQFPGVWWPMFSGKHLGCGVVRALWSAEARTVVLEVPDDWCADMRGALVAGEALHPQAEAIIVIPEEVGEATMYLLDDAGEDSFADFQLGWGDADDGPWWPNEV